MVSMFYHCSSLTTLDVSGWDTSKVSNMGYMFKGCSSLTTLDLSGWDTSKVGTSYSYSYGLTYTFSDCTRLASLKLGERFRFKGTYISSLPGDYWWLENDEWNTKKTCQEFWTGYDGTEPGTYIRKVAYAVLYDDGELVFQMGAQTDNEREVIGTYAGFEKSKYTSTQLPPWASKREQIKKVTVRDVIVPVSTAFWFFNCTKCTEADLDKLDTSNVTDMNSMFRYCPKLTTLELSGWNTSNVTNMSCMFDQCSSLTTLDVSGWNTSNVKYMNYMFDQCSSLTTLDVSGWNTSNVTDMNYMFYQCSSLTTLDASGWNTSNVTNMNYMFAKCSLLTTIDMSGWDTAKVSSMSATFQDCNSLASLKLGEMFRFKGSYDSGYYAPLPGAYWGLDSAEHNARTPVKQFWTDYNGTMPGVYINKAAYGILYADGELVLQIGPIPDNGRAVIGRYGNVETSTSVLVGSNMSELKTVTMRDEISPISTTHWFSGCANLTKADLSKLDTSNVTDMSYMFYNCEKLTTLDVSGWDTSKVTNMSCMFYKCSSLTTLDVSGWDTSEVTNMGGMFYKCSSLTTLDVSGWDTSEVTNMGGMFYYCSSLTTLDASEWDTSKVTYMDTMFYHCSSLTTLNLSEWNTSSVTNMSSIFQGCNSLTSLKLGEQFRFKGDFQANNPPLRGDFWQWENGGSDDRQPVQTFWSEYDGSKPGVYKLASAYSILYTDGELVIQYGSETDGRPYFEKRGNFENKSESDYSLNSLTTKPQLVKRVTVKDIIRPISMRFWFDNYKNCTEMNLAKINTSNVRDMSYMFDLCSSLASLDITGWTLSQTNASGLFKNCNSLKTIRLGAESYLVLRNNSLPGLSWGPEWTDEKELTAEFIKHYGHGIPGTYVRKDTFVTLYNDGTLVFSDKEAAGSHVVKQDAYCDLLKWSVPAEDREKVRSVVVQDPIHPATTPGMFAELSNCVTMNLSNLDMANVQDASTMFSNCKSLQHIDMQGWNTAKLVNAYSMFKNCVSLRSIDLSNWDTSNVTNMGFMFYNCSSLETIDVSSFDTSKATNMSYMFANCNNITFLDISGFDMQQNPSTFGMLEMTKLSVVILGGLNHFSNSKNYNESAFDTVNSTNSQYWVNTDTERRYYHKDLNDQFTGDMAGVYLRDDLSAFYFPDGTLRITARTNDVTPYGYGQAEKAYLFYGSTVYSKTSLPWRDKAADIKKVVVEDSIAVLSTESWFNGLAVCEETDLRKLDTGYAKHMDKMFEGCDLLESVGLGPYFTFKGNKLPKENWAILPKGIWKLDNLEYNAETLQSNYKRPGFYFREIPKPKYKGRCGGVIWEIWTDEIMYLYPANGVYGETGFPAEEANGDHIPWLPYADEISVVEIRNGVGIENISRLFEGCAKIQEIDLSNLMIAGTRADIRAAHTFDGCTALATVRFGNAFGSTPFSSTQGMFRGCAAMESADLTGVSLELDKDMSGMFEDCTALTSVTFNTDAITGTTNDMSRMFKGCTALEAVTLPPLAADTLPAYLFPVPYGKAHRNGSAAKENSKDLVREYPNATYEHWQDDYDYTQAKGKGTLQTAGMFEGCTALKEFGFERATQGTVARVADSAEAMFKGCTSLTAADLSIIAVNGSAGSMFEGCKLLEAAEFGRVNADNMNAMFKDCESLASVDTSVFNTRWTTDMAHMFENTASLAGLDTEKFMSTSLTDATAMFRNSGITDITLGRRFNAAFVTSMESMFEGCGAMEQALLFMDGSSTTSLASMFKDCALLQEIDLPWLTAQNTETANSMFAGCTSLKKADIRMLGTNRASDLGNMFDGTQLNSIVIGNSFSFTGNSISDTGLQAQLPDAPEDETYTGKWIRKDRKEGPYTAEELRILYTGSMAGTWRWERIVSLVTLTLDANGGEFGAGETTKQIQNDETVECELPTPVRMNYYAEGWNTRRDGKGDHYDTGAAFTTDEDTVLYAEWRYDTRGTVTVRYMLEDADETWHAERTDVLTGWPGETFTPEVLAFEGFETPEAQSVTPEEEKFSETVEYRYPALKFTVRFDGNGADEGTMEPQTVMIPYGALLRDNAYSKTKAVFTGWNTRADGTGESYGERQSVTGEPGETILLYAQWYLINTEDIIPQDGKFTATVKPGQSAVMELPAGSSYNIVERDLAHWQQTANERSRGVIETMQDSEAEFTNRYTPDPAHIAIIAHKDPGGSNEHNTFILDGTGIKAEELDGQGTLYLGGNRTVTVIVPEQETVHITAGDASWDTNGGTYTVTSDRITISGGTATVQTNIEPVSMEVQDGAVDAAEKTAEGDNPWYGTQPVRFDLPEITEPGTYTFTIRQVEGNGPVHYDTHTETVTVTARDVNGTITAEVSSEPLFTNRIKEGIIRIHTENEGPDVGFTYVIDATDGNVERVPFTVKKGGEEFPYTDGITLKNGETAEIALPAGTDYEIRQVPRNNWTAETEKESGTAEAGTERDYTFRNTYYVMRDFAPDARVSVIGEKIEGHEFKFRLLDKDGTLLDEATAGPDGVITFVPQTLKSGQNVFYVQGVEGTERFQYDTHTEPVTVSFTWEGEFTAKYREGDACSFTAYAKRTLTVENNVPVRDTAFHYTLTSGDVTKEADLKNGEKETLELLHGDEWHVSVTPSDQYMSDKTEAGGTIEKDTTVSFTHKYKVGLQLLKVDEEGKPLDGAKLQIRRDGKTVHEWEGHEKTVILTDPGTYTIHEASAPKNYLPFNDVTFELTNDGTLQGEGIEDGKITLTDPYKAHNVRVRVVNERGKRLPGATIAIRGLEEKQTSKDTEDNIFELKPGTYTAEETPPEEYEGAEPEEFTVDIDGSVIVDGKKTGVVILKDSRVYPVVTEEEAVARVRENEGDWRLFAHLVTGNMTTGAFDYANELEGKVEIETLKVSTPAYTQETGFTFDNKDITSLSLRTATTVTDDEGNALRSRLVKKQAESPMITFDGAIGSVSVSYMQFEGGGVENESPQNGGALSIRSAEAEISSCSFKNFGAGANFSGGAVAAGSADGEGSGTLAIKECEFTNCRAEHGTAAGGAVYFGWTGSESRLTAEDSTFENCVSATNGGAICTAGGSTPVTVELKGTTISKCRAGTDGGAVYAGNAETALEGCILTYNQAAGNGGAVYVPAGTLGLESSTPSVMEGNQAPKGGAVYLASGAAMDFTDGSAVMSNTAYQAGAGIYLEEGSTLRLEGSPNFGGAGMNGPQIDTEAGNFVSGTMEGKVNGGAEYTKKRQDIYIAGYETEGAESLIITGALTAEDEGGVPVDGWIWVWSEHEEHYIAGKQFASFAENITGTGTGNIRLADNTEENAALVEHTVHAFRNSRDDVLTKNMTGAYLTGGHGRAAGLIVWDTNGYDAVRHVVLAKVGGEQFEPLAEAEFTVYLNRARTAVASGIIETWNEELGKYTEKEIRLKNLKSDMFGHYFVGTLSSGTYYVEETKSAGGYEKPDHLFVLEVDRNGSVTQKEIRASEDGEDSIIP